MPSIAGHKYVRVEGLQEAQNLIREFSGEPIKNAPAVLMTLGDQIVNDMQSLAPVDTGFMRDEIAVTGVSNDSVTVEAAAAYSGFVEYGTVHQSPQPFFQPPIEQLNADVIIDDIIRNYNDLVARHNPFRGGFSSVGRQLLT